jgi:LPS export ABC transporter protein LptC
VRRVLRRLVPAAALAALAAAACNEVQEPPVAVQGVLADSADQIILGAHQLITDRGVLRAELNADTAFIFNEGTRIELRKVNTTFFNGTGAKNATLTSREGTYNTQIGQMEARKKVVVVSVDGRRLTTEQLRFNEQANLITSDSAFTASQGARTLQGVGFESDPNMINVRCRAACRGEVGQVSTPQTGAGNAAAPAAAVPPPEARRPNSFVLPGQQVPPPAPAAPSTGAPVPRTAPAQPPPAQPRPTRPAAPTDSAARPAARGAAPAPGAGAPPAATPPRAVTP